MNNNYRRFLDEITTSLKGAEGRVYGSVAGYPLAAFETKGKTRLLITTGFHGDEQAGPLTLVKHGPKILKYAEDSDVGLRIYPCTNPSGWSTGYRYNLLKESQNNSIIEYLVDGSWKGELLPEETFEDYRLKTDLSKETRALVGDIALEPIPEAALDIHQDGEIKGEYAYAYVYGDRKPYIDLVNKSSKFAEPAADKKVDKHVKTDTNGLTTLHDGSIQDYFFRRGTPFSATLETTLDLPIEQAMAVNLTWIFGFIDLAAPTQKDRRPK